MFMNLFYLVIYPLEHFQSQFIIHLVLFFFIMGLIDSVLKGFFSL